MDYKSFKYLKVLTINYKFTKRTIIFIIQSSVFPFYRLRDVFSCFKKPPVNEQSDTILKKVNGKRRSVDLMRKPIKNNKYLISLASNQNRID